MRWIYGPGLWKEMDPMIFDEPDTNAVVVWELLRAHEEVPLVEVEVFALAGEAQRVTLRFETGTVHLSVADGAIGIQEGE